MAVVLSGVAELSEKTLGFREEGFQVSSMPFSVGLKCMRRQQTAQHDFFSTLLQSKDE